MKKSEIYKAAQIAVFKDDALTVDDALEVLYVLMEAERLALFTEEREAENNGDC